jgi:hypothetical protein
MWNTDRGFEVFRDSRRNGDHIVRAGVRPSNQRPKTRRAESCLTRQTPREVIRLPNHDACAGPGHPRGEYCDRIRRVQSGQQDAWLRASQVPGQSWCTLDHTPGTQLDEPNTGRNPRQQPPLGPYEDEIDGMPVSHESPGQREQDVLGPARDQPWEEDGHPLTGSPGGRVTFE